MAEDKIDSYIDRTGVKGDTDFILESLNRVYTKFKDIEGIKVDMRGFSGLGQIAPAMQQAKAGADSLAEATKVVEQRMASMPGKSKEFTQVLALQARAEKEVATATLQTAKARAIEERLIKATTKEKEKLNKEALREAERAAKLNNEYEQLKAKYTIAANTAKQLAAAKGLDNAETKLAVAQAQKYYDSLIKIETAVGQAQRQVGQYQQATFALTQVLREAPAFANSFATGISAVSNNLPILIDQYKSLSGQIGKFNAFKVLAGSLLSLNAILPIGFLLVQSYGKEIGSFFSNLFSGGKAFNAMKEAQKGLNDAMKEGRQTALQQVGELEALYEVSQDVTQSLATRRDASKRIAEITKEVNEETGTNVQLVTDQNGVLQAQPDLIDKISEALLRQAKTKAALNLIEKAYSSLIEAQTASLNSQTTVLQDVAIKTNNIFAKVLPFFNTGGTFRPKTFSLQVIQQEEKDKEVKKAEEYLAALKKVFSDGLKTGEFSIDGLFGGEDAGGDDQKKNLKAAADKRLQALAELRAIELQQDVDFNKERVDNEELSLTDRLRALQKYYQARKQLIDLQKDTEKAVGEKTSEEVLVIETQRADELLRLDRETYAQRDKLIKDFSKAFKDEEKKMQDGLAKLAEEGYKRFEKLEEERTKKGKEEAKKRLKDEEEYAKNKKALTEQLVRELTALTFTLFTSGLDREKNALQEQIDLLEQKKQKDIEVANQTIANSQERADTIAVIEARANAQREELQRRQRDLDIRKAQFDKARAIANIIQETAKNIVEYFGTPLALIAGAIGAVQIATVMAQPIPRYKHGKNVSDLYEGPAIVGDGGKKEAIIREDGAVEITPDRPTLTYVKSRDVVLPDANQLINYVLAGHMGGRLAVPGASVAKRDNVEKKLDEVVAAIKAQPRTEIKAGEGGLTQVIKYGSTQLRYINDQTNW